MISFLDEKGRPGITQRVYVIPPGSQIGPIEDAQRRSLLANSIVAGVYDKTVDRESAYEVLQARAAEAPTATGGVSGNSATAQQGDSGLMGGLNDFLFGSTGPRGGKKDGLVQSLVKSTARNMSNQLGRQLLRGVLGSLTGSKK